MSIEISQIQPQKRNKDRFNLYAEEGFLTSLSYETILKYNIREGRSIEEEVLERAKQDDTVKYAKEQAMQYVAYAPRSKRQVRKRLEQKGIDAESIDQAVSTMEHYGYIDDGFYVQEMARSYKKKLGAQAIRQKLLQNGVADKVIAQHLQIPESEQLAAAKEYVHKSAAKYARIEPQKAKQRLYAALQRRGFSPEVIRSAMKEASFVEQDDMWTE